MVKDKEARMLQPMGLQRVQNDWVAEQHQELAMVITPSKNGPSIWKSLGN